MATKVGSVGGVKAVKASKPGSNGASTPTLSARIKPVPAKVLKHLAALGDPYRLKVLGFVAAAAAPVTLADVAGHLGGGPGAASLAVDWLKQRGWLASERVPKGGGGGWCYRLSDAGRELLMALGG